MAARKPRLKVTLDQHEVALAQVALALPEVVEEHPWGHRAFKVKKKTFLFLSRDDGGLSLSVKLPHSGGVALTLPFAEPTAYGLGKAGWVSASFTRAGTVPQAMLAAWVLESYRALAPKKLSDTLPRLTR